MGGALTSLEKKRVKDQRGGFRNAVKNKKMIGYMLPKSTNGTIPKSTNGTG